VHDLNDKLNGNLKLRSAEEQMLAFIKLEFSHRFCVTPAADWLHLFQTITQVLQERVEEEHRGVLNGVQEPIL
jgi:hypothetical protein